jgi:hypothetical protein
MEVRRCRHSLSAFKKEQTMGKKPAKRHNGQSHSVPEQPRDLEATDNAPISARQRKDANHLLSQYCEQHSCGLSGLLKSTEQQARGGRTPLYVFEVLIERVEGQRKNNRLSIQEVADLEGAKTAIKQIKQ